MKGSIIQIQNFSVNDGNGIRTTVFFAGCPLHCQWCANPEGLTKKRKIAYYSSHCVECGQCVTVCPENIGIDLNKNREQCIACGRCVEVCPKGARKLLTREVSVEEIVDIIKPQMMFYRKSNGGITFSGGEATIQKEFLRALSQRLFDMGLSLALETSGYFVFDEVKDILEQMELIFVDIKHMDDEKHKYFTGKSNKIILDNIKRMGEISVPIVVRVPVINGVNMDKENIRATAEFVKNNLPYAKIELLPYHRYGEAKYEALNTPLPSSIFNTPSVEEMTKLKNLVMSVGVEVIDFL